jgi:hypothetical protein
MGNCSDCPKLAGGPTGEKQANSNPMLLLSVGVSQDDDSLLRAAFVSFLSLVGGRHTVGGHQIGTHLQEG